MLLNQAIAKELWEGFKDSFKEVENPKDLLILLSIPGIVVTLYAYMYFTEIVKKRQWFKKGDLVKNSLNGNIYIILDELQMDEKQLTLLYKGYNVDKMIEEKLFCEEVHLKKYT